MKFRHVHSSVTDSSEICNLSPEQHTQLAVALKELNDALHEFGALSDAEWFEYKPYRPDRETNPDDNIGRLRLYKCWDCRTPQSVKDKTAAEHDATCRFRGPRLQAETARFKASQGGGDK